MASFLNGVGIVPSFCQTCQSFLGLWCSNYPKALSIPIFSFFLYSKKGQIESAIILLQIGTLVNLWGIPLKKSCAKMWDEKPLPWCIRI